MAAMMAAVLIVASPSACASGTGDHGGLTQLDDNGYLYFMDYKKDYYSPEVMDAMRKLGYIDPGCSAFFTHNTEGEPITCRNYDVLHPLLQRFGPDQEGFDPDWLDILPYQCMDGINEKGLYVSIQRVDIKEGEQPARFPAGSSMLLRFILDDCADVDEAVRKTKTGIMVPEDWQNCHFMVSDPSGRSLVIESRNSVISVIPSDICTNFYLASDDMEDSYRNGCLREEAVKMTEEDMTPDYHYGYGHGYHRFATILAQLECYRDTTKEQYYTVMPESAAQVILRSVVQNPYTAASGVSMTQYSAIYNNEKKTVEVWPFQDYSESFVFDVSGNLIPADG